MQRFEADVEGGVAYCAYTRRGDGVLSLHHTEVPREAEGRGVASTIVKAALAYAEANALRVSPDCSYVRQYMARHRETHKLLSDNVTI
ncbi:MAG TPA: GNAT family N-acetyltransferase [Casimicrobiaceae bacterium]|nr:GNAT family N-acetyltransferase [Casimicrobiaceae bacterium]